MKLAQDHTKSVTLVWDASQSPARCADTKYETRISTRVWSQLDAQTNQQPSRAPRSGRPYSDSTSQQSETRNRQTQDTLHAVRSHARRSFALKIASALFLRRPSEVYCAYRLCKPRFDLTVLIIHLPYLYNQKRTDAAKISPPFVNGRTAYSVPAV